jgi:hypothetical protein
MEAIQPFKDKVVARLMPNRSVVAAPPLNAVVLAVPRVPFAHIIESPLENARTCFINTPAVNVPTTELFTFTIVVELIVAVYDP